MSDVYRWQAGEYLMVAGPNGVVLLDPQIGVQLAERIFEELQRGATLGAILQLLTNAYDLWTIPPFVVALRSTGDLQVVVRGPMHVRISSAEGDDRMSGRGVSTWTERLFEQVRSFSVSCTEHVDGPSLPVTGAVLWANSISWGEDGPDEPERLHEAAHPEPARPSPFAPAPIPAGVAAAPAGMTPAPPEAVHHREPTGIQAPIVRPGPDAEDGSEPTPDPDPEPEHPVADGAPDDSSHGDEPPGHEPAEDALQQAVSLTKTPSPGPAGTRPDPADPEPAEREQPEDGPGAPEPTAVLPLVPGDPAGEGPRLTGSETLPEVDWEMPPPAPAPEPGPGQVAEAPGTPADLLSGPVWGAPGGDGPRGEQPAAGWEGAHGGDTMSSPNLGAKLLGRLLGTPADEAEPTVLALVCGDGHPSPPHTSFCSECGQRLVGPPRRAPRPSLGLLTTPDGEVVVLTRSVIVGRSPSAERSSTRDQPRLLTVPSPNQEISRSHVEICLEGWSVLARDLGSSNGTLLVRDGDTPVKLPQTSPLQLQSGDVLDLGEGVRLSLSELP